MPGIGTGNDMDLLATAASGMREQRAVLDLAARNVAAAQASSPGHPYARLVAQFADAPAELGVGAEDADASVTGDDDGEPDADLPGNAGIAVRSEPGSGDALAEMIAVLDAQRAYEQHASVFDIGKRLAERTIDMGRS